jgi:putative lipoprotein
MLDRIAELLIFGFTPLAIGMLVAPGVPKAEEHLLKGAVTYRERIALPPGALVTVQLADVSLADAPAAVIAEQKIAPTGQLPIPFELTFNTSAIEQKSTYALQARITFNDQLMFMATERYEVDPLVDAPQTVVVTLVRKKGVEAVPIVGQVWSLQFIDGIGGVESKATFHVDDRGKVTGQALCNRYFASAKIEGSALTVGKPGATMMACEARLMTQEQAFFDALEKVAGFRVENGRLILTAAGGRELLRFAASA